MSVPRLGATAGLFAAGLVVSIGTAWAFARGGQDFAVFYHAWGLASSGRLMDLYSDSPDRFLYAPGFAYTLRFLSVIPRDLALALLCLLKAACLGLMIREFMPVGASPRLRVGIAGASAWAVVLLARPVLIDFQYGQLNLILVAAGFWALSAHLSGDRGWRRSLLPWTVFSFLAVAKPTAAPLLIVPYLNVVSLPEKSRRERAGVLLGIVLSVAGLLAHLGWAETWRLHGLWVEALRAKAVPFESHNQSVLAVLHHWLSGEPIRSLALGAQTFTLGPLILEAPALQLIGVGFSVLSLGSVLAWLLNSYGRGGFTWIGVALAATILPSHLVWKPYFVFALPSAMLVAGRMANPEFRSPATVGLVGFAFFALNLTGIDVLGRAGGAWIEASGVLLLAYLAWIAAALVSERSRVSALHSTTAH